MRDDLMQGILEYLLTIPEGKVVTYKQVAEYLGNPGYARIVGNLLHVNPDPERYPCFQVVNHKGRLAPNFGFGGAEAQKIRLERDGIRVSEDYYVDLEEYQWKEG
ncbi:MAG: MGMT family protein [Clostridiales bacterium]|nr:MGMT family protein [Candidatus Crickella equi]